MGTDSVFLLEHLAVSHLSDSSNYVMNKMSNTLINSHCMFFPPNHSPFYLSVLEGKKQQPPFLVQEGTSVARKAHMDTIHFPQVSITLPLTTNC